MKAFWDYVSLSIVGLIAFPVLRFATTLQPKYAIMLLGIILSDYGTKLVKDLTKDMEPEVLKRPRGASDCDFFCRNGDCEYNPGMPSGHMATTTFALTFMYLAEDGIKNRAAFAAFAVVTFVLMGFARYMKRCHNVPQILLGGLWGALCAWAVVRLMVCCGQ